MKQNNLDIGDRVKLLPESLAWKGEIKLRNDVGKVTEFGTMGASRSAFKTAGFSWAAMPMGLKNLSPG